MSEKTPLAEFAFLNNWDALAYSMLRCLVRAAGPRDLAQAGFFLERRRALLPVQRLPVRAIQHIRMDKFCRDHNVPAATAKVCLTMEQWMLKPEVAADAPTILTLAIQDLIVRYATRG